MNKIHDFYITLRSDNLNKNYFVDQEKLSGQIGENAFRGIWDSVFETTTYYIIDGLNEAGYKNLTDKDLANNPNMISINAEYYNYVDKDIANTDIQLKFLIKDKNNKEYDIHNYIDDIHYAKHKHLDNNDNEMISLIIQVHGKMLKADNIQNIMRDAMNLAKKQDKLLGDLCTEDFYVY